MLDTHTLSSHIHYVKSTTPSAAIAPGAARASQASERIVMPSHDAMRAPDPVPADRRLSRRSLLRGTAAAGAAGLAAASVGAAASPALAAPSQPAHQRLGPGPATLPSGPIVVHVRDAESGDIEMFRGTGQTRLRDKDLAARIARAIG
jgi:hypothetical protein